MMLKQSSSKLKKQIPCVHCGCRSLIANTALYQTHWYVQPSGCTDGDYWLPGECQFVCHHCGVVNRLLFNTTYDYSKRRSVSEKNDLFELKYKNEFKEIIDTHGDDENPTASHRWVNNYWIDALK